MVPFKNPVYFCELPCINFLYYVVLKIDLQNCFILFESQIYLTTIIEKKVKSF